MATALREGGLYKTEHGKFVDANGAPVPGAEAKAATAGAKAPASASNDGGFDADFPGRTAFLAAGLSRADVDAMDRDALLGTKGVGEATADAILKLREAA